MILLLTQCFPPTHGGIETLMKGMADALSTTGRDVQVFADGYRTHAEIDHDAGLEYPVRRFGGPKPWRRRRKGWSAGAFLETHAVDTIICDSWKSAEHTARRARHAGVPLVCLAHGNDVLVPDRGRRRRRVARVLRLAHKVVANSRDTASRVRSLSIADSRIAIVHPGVVPPRVDRAECADVAPPGRPRLLTLGRIEARKGHDFVIRSLPALLALHPDLSYVIAGDGPARAPLEKLVDSLGLRDHVCFTGAVSESEKAALIASSDLFVMASRFEPASRSVEGFGIVYLEAAWCGVPSVAGRSGGAGDAVIDGVTGALCDADRLDSVQAAIVRCLADPERLRELGAAARERAQREFGWPIVIERYLQCARREN